LSGVRAFFSVVERVTAIEFALSALEINLVFLTRTYPSGMVCSGVIV
jgi:hypothetical protein